MGFGLIDEQVMTILSIVVRVKLDQLLALRRKSELEREVTQTIRLAGAICTQRSQADLVKHVKLTLPGYFGFEGASILLRDVKTNLIFTINELSKEDSKKSRKVEVASGDNVNSKPESHKETADTSTNEDNSAAAATREMRETVKITFPNNQGISGKVFHGN